MYFLQCRALALPLVLLLLLFASLSLVLSPALLLSLFLWACMTPHHFAGLRFFVPQFVCCTLRRLMLSSVPLSADLCRYGRD